MKPPVDMNGPSLTPRVERLRENVLSRTGEFHQWFSLRTESLSRTEGEPIIIRRAKAFAYMLDQMPLEIPAGALIIGRHPRTVVSDAERTRLRAEYANVANPPDDATIHFQDEGLFRAPVIPLHLAPDTEKALRLGLGGYRDAIKARGEMTQAESEKEFLAAALITIEAAIRFIQRHGELVAIAAAEASDTAYGQELAHLALVCSQIATEPPQSFHATLQLTWFIYFMVNLEIEPMVHCAGPGTLDRWLINFYHTDISSGRLAPEDALELIECFFVEMNASISRGGILPLTIGGMGEGGVGVENELTWLCLKAVGDLRLLHPSLALRYHREMPKELLRAALRIIGSGSTYPALFNDSVCVRALRRSGVSQHDAWDWVHSICTELTAVGKTDGWIAAPYFNLAKCLELTLNHGRCLVTGKQLGEDLGGLSDYAGFEDLYATFLEQVSYLMNKGVEASAYNERQVAERAPSPFLSCFTADCIDKALDFTAGGARYNPDYIQGIGISTAVDSLAALRYFVYDKKMISSEDFLVALKADFQGHETLRQRLLNLAPKFGNDDDYVDELYARLVQDFYQEVSWRINGRGGPCLPGFMTWETHNLLGKATGASADGRLAGAALSDSVGAVQGMDHKGLTALLRSVTRADFSPAVGGVTFNIKVSPEMFANDAMLERLEAALISYFDAGGFQVQVNVLSREMLEEAKAHPEQHRNLMVRVGGFSAYFVELDPGIQDELIARTSHE